MPLSTRETRKAVTRIKRMKHTSYSTVNKRVGSLTETGFLLKTAVKERPGGIADYYELTLKAYLAVFFDSISIEDLLSKINHTTAWTLLETLLATTIL